MKTVLEARNWLRSRIIEPTVQCDVQTSGGAQGGGAADASHGTESQRAERTRQTQVGQRTQTILTLLTRHVLALLEVLDQARHVIATRHLALVCHQFV